MVAPRHGRHVVRKLLTLVALTVLAVSAGHASAATVAEQCAARTNLSSSWTVIYAVEPGGVVEIGPCAGSLVRMTSSELRLESSGGTLEVLSVSGPASATVDGAAATLRLDSPVGPTGGWFVPSSFRVRVTSPIPVTLSYSARGAGQVPSTGQAAGASDFQGLVLGFRPAGWAPAPGATVAEQCAALAPSNPPPTLLTHVVGGGLLDVGICGGRDVPTTFMLVTVTPVDGWVEGVSTANGESWTLPAPGSVRRELVFSRLPLPGGAALPATSAVHAPPTFRMRVMSPESADLNLDVEMTVGYRVGLSNLVGTVRSRVEGLTPARVALQLTAPSTVTRSTRGPAPFRYSGAAEVPVALVFAPIPRGTLPCPATPEDAGSLTRGYFPRVDAVEGVYRGFVRGRELEPGPYLLCAWAVRPGTNDVVLATANGAFEVLDLPTRARLRITAPRGLRALDDVLAVGTITSPLGKPNGYCGFERRRLFGGGKWEAWRPLGKPRYIGAGGPCRLRTRAPSRRNPRAQIRVRFYGYRPPSTIRNPAGPVDWSPSVSAPITLSVRLDVGVRPAGADVSRRTR